MNPALQPLAKLLSLHTRLFENCLDGVEGAVAQQRPNEHTNHLAFLASHLADARFYLARLLGSSVESPFKELDAVRRVEEMHVVPALSEIRAAWVEVAVVLSARFASIRAEELALETAQKFPLGDGTLLDGIAFLLHHEAYHMGQMAMLRKYFGLRPMRYD